MSLYLWQGTWGPALPPPAADCTAAFFLHYRIIFQPEQPPSVLCQLLSDVQKRRQQYLNIPLGVALDTVLSNEQGHCALLELGAEA